MSDALVLGGGGIAGIAWMTGLLAGAADQGVDLTKVSRIVGTSAGATVAAQVGGGLGIQDLFARQTEPARQVAEIAAQADLTAFSVQIGTVVGTGGSAASVRQAVGRFALDTATVSEEERLEVIRSRLPSHEWPAGEPDLRIVAVDAVSGEPRVFDRVSGVSLVDAVAASCAVPGLWPPVTIDGRRYVDGAVRSNTSADCTSGATRVLVVAPLGSIELFPVENTLPGTIAALRASGTQVAVIQPDEASVAAIGPNPADPATRVTAAEAGRAQGRRLRLRWT